MIIHVGTNSLQESESPAAYAAEITELARTVGQLTTETEVIISSLIFRYDDSSLGKQVNKVNSILSKSCSQYNCKFVDHSNSTQKHLNWSGLLLNMHGTSQLAHNFLNVINHNNNWNTADWESHDNSVLPDDHIEFLAENSPLNIDHEQLGRGLVMAFWNINSLLAHIDKLRVYMDANKIDILAINETKLDSTIENSEIYLQVLKLLEKMLGWNGRGVCIYLQSNINYITRDDLSSNKLECLMIEITKPHSKSLLTGTMV